jgi:MFS family permease
MLITAYATSQAAVSPLAGQVADRVGVGRTLELSMVANRSRHLDFLALLGVVDSDCKHGARN